MAKSKKKILTLLISVLAIISTCLSIGFAVNTNVKASNESVFEMDYGASVRVTEPNTGLRFKTKLSKDYFDRLTADGATETLFTAIFPSEDYLDFVSSGQNLPIWLKEEYGEGKYINLEIPANKIYQGEGENSQYYYANAVISNVYLKNYHRKFIGVSYIVSGDDYECAKIVYEDNSRSIFEVACKANLDEEDHALYGDVLEKLIKNGMYAPYGVTYDKDSKKYTLNGQEYDSINDIENDLEIAVSLDGATLNKGEKTTLTPQVTYADGTVFEKEISCVYSSSNQSVATVDEKGEITAIEKGETIITVKAAGGLYETSCTVTVNEVEPIGEIIADCVYEMSGFETTDEETAPSGFTVVSKYEGKGYNDAGEFIHGAYYSGVNLDACEIVTFGMKTPAFNLNGEETHTGGEWMIFTLTQVSPDTWDLVITSNGETIYTNKGLRGAYDSSENSNYSDNALDAILYGNPRGFSPKGVDGLITVYVTEFRGVAKAITPMGEIIQDCVYNMSDFAENDEIETPNGFEKLYKYVGPGHGTAGEYIHGVYMSNLCLDEYGIVTFAIKSQRINLGGTWNESNKWLVFTLTRVDQCEWDLVVTNLIGQTVHEKARLSGNRTDGSYVYNAINSILYGVPSPGYYPGGVTGDITVYVTELRGVKDLSWVNKNVVLYDQIDGIGTVYKTITASFDVTELGVDLSKVTSLEVDGAVTTNYSVSGSALNVTGLLAGDHVYTLVMGEREYDFIGCAYEIGITNAVELEAWRLDAVETPRFAVLLNDIEYDGSLKPNGVYNFKSLDGRGYSIKNFTVGDGGFFHRLWSDTSVFRNVKFVNATKDCANYVEFGFLGQWNKGIMEDIYVDLTLTNVNSMQSSILVWGLNAPTDIANYTTTLRNVFVKVSGNNGYAVKLINRFEHNTQWMNIVGVGTNVHENDYNDSGVGYYSTVLQMLQGEINDELTTFTSPYWVIDEINGIINLKPLIEEVKPVVSIDGEFVGKVGKNLTVDLSDSGIDVSKITSATCDGNEVNFSVSGTSIVLLGLTAGDYIILAETEDEIYKISVFVEAKPIISIDGEFVGKVGENLTVYLSDSGIDVSKITSATCDGSKVNFSVSGTSIVLSGLTVGDRIILAETEDEIYTINAFVYDTEITTAEQLTAWLANPSAYAVLLSHINYDGATLNMGGNVTGVLNGLGYTVSNFTYSTGIVDGISASGGIKNVCFTGAKQDVNGNTNRSCGLLGKTVSGYIKNLYVELSLINCDVEHYGVLAATVSGSARNVIVYISSSNVEANHYVISDNIASVYEEVYGVYSNGVKYILAWASRNGVGEWSRANTYGSLEELTDNCLSVLTWGDYWNNSWNSIKMNPNGGEGSQKPDVENGYIVKDGETEYVVVVSEDDINDVSTAAKELYDIFLEATGIELQFVKDSAVTYNENSKYISLGRSQISEVLGNDVDDLGEQGFILKTEDQSIFILGNPQGVLYGVYEFLNQTLNFETYTKDIYTLNTGVTELVLPNFDVTQTPDIEYRIQFSGAQYNDELSRRRMRTMRSDDVIIGGGGAHNMLEYIVPFDNYSSHKTWFSNKTGSKDTYLTTQLCYTAGGRGTSDYNQMLGVAIENVKNMIANDDKYVFSLTQMDVQDKWCNCSACKEVINTYGSNSATQILFINDLVSAVNSWLKTEKGGRKVQFMTFAYYETETAPTKGEIKLDDSVAIWVAPIAGYREGNGVTAGRESLESLINSWKSVASSVSVWAYGVYFNEYLVPYNNYDVLDELVKTAESGNAKYMWIQGNWNTEQNSCFDSLKEYLISKLMWNTDADVGLLTEKFFNAVYGPAASDMMTIYTAMKTELNDMITNAKLKTGIYSAPCGYGDWGTDYLKNQLKALEVAIGKLNTADSNYQKYYNAIVCESISFRYIYKENNNFLGVLGGKDYESSAWGSFKEDVTRLGFTRTGEGTGKEMTKYALLNK